MDFYIQITILRGYLDLGQFSWGLSKLAIFKFQSHLLKPKFNLIILKMIFVLEYQIIWATFVTTSLVVIMFNKFYLVQICSFLVGSQLSCVLGYQKSLKFINKAIKVYWVSSDSPLNSTTVITLTCSKLEDIVKMFFKKKFIIKSAM